jgi:hypothetical protein
MLNLIDEKNNQTGFNRKFTSNADSPEYFLTSVVQGTGTGLDELYYRGAVIESWDESWDFNVRENRQAQYFNNNYDQQGRFMPTATDVSRKLSFSLKPSFDDSNADYYEERQISNYELGRRIATGYLGEFSIDDQAPNTHFSELFEGLAKYKSQSGTKTSNGDWYDHKLTINTNPNNLSFDITETATYLSNKTDTTAGSWAVLHDEEYSISQDGYNVEITVNGTIQGFERNLGMAVTGTIAGLGTSDQAGFSHASKEDGDIDFSKIAQATNYFSGAINDTFGSASGYYSHISGWLFGADCTYIPNALNARVTAPNRTIGVNPAEGTITYSITYDNRFETCFESDPCILSSTIDISDTNTTEIVAQQNIIGRGQGYGPILQNTNAWSAKVKSISVELVGRPATGCGDGTGILDALTEFSPEGLVQTLIDNVSGSLAAQNSQVFLQSDNSTYNPITGRYTRNVDFLYGNCTTT